MIAFARGWILPSLAALLIFPPVTHTASAQGTAEDYRRAAELRQRFAGKVYRDRMEPNWIAASDAFWYRVLAGPNQHEFVFVDAAAGIRQPAFDHTRLATELGKTAGREVNPKQLPFRELSFSDDLDEIRFVAFDQPWRWSRREHSLTKGDETAVPETTEQTGVEVLQQLRASGATAVETHITFINQTMNDIQLYWIDSAGNRRLYETLQAGKTHSQHTYASHVWLATVPDGQPLAAFAATEAEGTAIIDGTQPVPAERRRNNNRANRGSRNGAEGQSPDRKWRIAVEEHNLILQAGDGPEQRKVTTDGTEDHPWTGRVHWSPDSSHFVAIRERQGTHREIFFVESSPSDQLQPKLHTMSYAKPGDEIDRPSYHLFDVATGEEIPISPDLSPTPWSLSDIQWAPDSSRFTFLYNQRGHQVLRVISVDATSGEARALIDETSSTFLDYAGKLFLRRTADHSTIIWMSERSGWNHLYRIDGVTGEVLNPITSGAWVVRGVEHVDEEKQQIRFTASGLDPDEDPYHVHYCRVNFDGEGFTRLTEGDGTHRVTFSPDEKYVIDRYSRVDLPPVTELRRTSDGSLVCVLEESDISPLSAEGWKPPTRFAAKGRDGITDIYGILHFPTNFDSGRSYPVIEQIYAGPHSAFVPRTFASYHNAQHIAELGFIVVQIDGMGTSHRSKAFHDVAWQNLGDSGFPDRILWMQAAAQKYPQMDLTRVGIYGGSAGGQSSTRAVLAFGEFYQVAVSDCGCHDNRVDKIWWNELWMGWPIGPHYEEQSNVTNAHRLTGKLLLIVGEMDRNVDPASTMQVVSALIKADKDFDLLIVPGGGHGIAESPYGRRRRADFFVRHLLGREPRAE